MAKPSTSERAFRVKAPAGLNLSKQQQVELYEYMRTTRLLEERLGILYRQNQVVGGLYSSLGQEATSVGSAYALVDGDHIGPLIRNLGASLVRGIPTRDFFSQYLARGDSPTGGRDGNTHFGDLSKGVIAPISMLGAVIPVMAGVAMVMKWRQRGNVALTYIGDGGTSTTDFHEGLNFAAVHRLPLVVIAEHNQWAYSTHVSKQFPVEHIADKGPSYGIHSEIVDGNNVLAVCDATLRARKKCVEGEGPVLLEAKTFRRKGHAEHDPAGYVPKAMREEWEAKDPLDAYTRYLVDGKLASREELAEIDAAIRARLEKDVEEVIKRPFPSPKSAGTGVYASDQNDGGSR